ncbi:hypothetical protein J7I98_33005 [Streptomyces sp. ISL-98]|uniref:hypothetical protein n=1 Tax=Streptomyces sp. ISL-98 TaxID=2819192 RepID=UPI001BE96586|nr:hypothetical protein [Streptomyces sp. ISL-98]MBT2510582.1 hypothetical protein [Streptomyces sp. ISL-98]
MPASGERSGLRGMPSAVGAGLLLVLSCGGPLLVAGVVAVAVGGARGSPFLIIVGALTVLIAVVAVVHALRCPAHRSRGSGQEGCRPYVTRPSSAADQRRLHSSTVEDVPPR